MAPTVTDDGEAVDDRFFGEGPPDFPHDDCKLLRSRMRKEEDPTSPDHFRETENNLFEEKLKLKKPRFIWRNAIVLLVLHVLAVYNFFNYITKIKLLTFGFTLLCTVMAGLGVTAGAHRLYTHRAYKAKPPLEVILLIFYSMAGMNTMYDWVRDHRVHHKYSETDADPHNAKRGFFFSHCGWLTQTKHPEVLRKGAQIDMSDITNNPLVSFHQKHFLKLQLLFCFIIPSIIPPLFWNESWALAFWVNSTVRYCIVLNSTWLVNSAAHIYGYKPYEANISPTQNWLVAFFAMGEGWHNYHHVFPWDYKADEFGPHALNFTTFVIDCFAKIGWAYDLKQPSKELVWRTAVNRGDGSHHSLKKNS
ncbi:(11Z)-hexadec-11-enoyl-CoA conjugase-like [Cimex lectularius]|uniref:Fatty acid desaturase domain-containing protein n=1 Tax=Cimex lectularius TaxID=79782 RepID=A0A8I6RXH3_CIMLE|nr:(11Z)-hexadec-11-enoyl-CoA conjugase-like [Cimex lectularius]XP_014252618.1 (11Z)-hexadec-11-enoyl-CoA conjugase-like [Cimex lectularius]XP_014252619.1 (11Z)-hexadec-11-enoyl-CoA conjugase-like [Cimex lectularius]XP_014252621.1 (11Z)-hexadec-11-enoyl-CoA conjugase-like [Cimex lectularius]XP_024086258.1 (11Z)-hexadec-11-enoyl-CoA conjugase-like [Cimex lectularius]